MIAFHEGLLLIRPVGTFCYYKKKKIIFFIKIQQKQEKKTNTNMIHFQSILSKQIKDKNIKNKTKEAT